MLINGNLEDIKIVDTILSSEASFDDDFSCAVATEEQSAQHRKATVAKQAMEAVALTMLEQDRVGHPNSTGFHGIVALRQDHADVLLRLRVLGVRFLATLLLVEIGQPCKSSGPIPSRSLDGMSESLPTSRVFFRRLHGYVAEQKLNLLQLAA